MLDFDEMLLQVGEFGLYQKALFAFQAPFCMFVTFVLFGQLFMTLYPMTIWCGGHFNCTVGNMTPFQRQNFSFSYTRGLLNPCFINNIDASFIKMVADMTNTGNCGTAPCNYTHGIGINANGAPPSSIIAPENYYYGGRGYYGQGRGPSAQNHYGSNYWNRPQWGGHSPTSGYQPRPPDTPDEGSNPTGSGYDHNDESWKEDAPRPDTQRSRRPGSKFPESPSTLKPRVINIPTPKFVDTTTDSDTFGRNPNSRPSGPNGKNINPNAGPGSEALPSKPEIALPFSDNRTCLAFGSGITELINVTMNNNRSRIFLPELDPRMSTMRTDTRTSTITTSGKEGPEITTTTPTLVAPVRPFVEYRTPPYLPVEQCYNVSWNAVQTGVPYPTIVTEGRWWCNAETYTTAAQAVFFLGAIVGGFLIGYIADNYGRVPALVIANLFGAVGGALSVVTTNFWLFMFFRFITGMAFDNCFTMMYILVLEFCGPTYRTLVANLSIAVFYTLGTLILPWLALAIGDWRIYGLAISLPMLSGLLAIFLVPESARWLLSKGRTKEATDILRSFAKVNRKKVDERVFVEFETDAKKIFDEMQAEEEEETFTAALKTPRLRRTFILLVLIWSVIALVYDGHSRNILNLADENWNVFWMFTIASMTEFPADMLLIFTLDRFGRRWLSFGSLTLSGAASIIAATIPQQMRTLSLVMAIISRFFVNVAFNIGLQYAAELLPTVIRAQGVNAIHIMGYVASIISPFVAAIGRTNPALSLILLGAFAIAGGCLSLFLAETLGEDLPNTLEEAEAFGIHQSFWNCPICAKGKDEEEHMPIQEPVNPEVIRRNNLRSTMRGETYRSSIISSSSRGSRRFPHHVALNPTPMPTETTKLRRITH